MATVKEWNTFEATMVAEGQFDLAGFAEEEVTEELILDAWQHLIDTGVVWQLQGSFGRAAARMIEEGLLVEAAA